MRGFGVRERHVGGDRFHARPQVRDALRKSLELPAGLDLLVEMRGAQRLEFVDVGLELDALQDVGVAGDQGLGLGGGEHDFVDVLDHAHGKRPTEHGFEAACLGLNRQEQVAIETAGGQVHEDANSRSRVDHCPRRSRAPARTPRCLA